MYKYVTCSFRQSLLSAIKHLYINTSMFVRFHFLNIDIIILVRFLLWCVFAQTMFGLPCCLHSNSTRKRKWVSEFRRSDYVILFVPGLFFLVRSGIQWVKEKNRSSFFSLFLFCIRASLFFFRTQYLYRLHFGIK